MSLPLATLNEIMGILPNASEHGVTIDNALEVCHWFMLALFLGWTAYFLYTIFRFHRSRHPKANYHGVKSKVSAHLELSVVLIEAVLLIGFAIPLWGARVTNFPDKSNALRVRAIGEQFKWTFHYPGPDNIFGRQSISYITSANPLGLDPEDADGQDDVFSTNELQLVNFRPTVIEISSKDVIHSLSLQHMRMDQDAIPGMRVPMWFRPTVAGSYEIVCAQLCGGNHYAMKAMMKVDDEKAFAEWEKSLSELQHPKKPEAAAAGAAPAPGAPAATTIPPASGAPAAVPAGTTPANVSPAAPSTPAVPPAQ